jgi:aminoglycoside 6'-N-acetyltransferase
MPAAVATMSAPARGDTVDRRPLRLPGEGLLLRTGLPADARALHRIRGEASVARWWGSPAPEDEIAAGLRGQGDEVALVIEVDGEVAGGIQFLEENDPAYRHASIDVYLAERFQGRALGREAVRVLAAHLLDVRGHHRLTIDPALANERAIRAYESLGFRRVGVLRQYERAPDGNWRDGLLLDLLAGELVGGTATPGRPRTDRTAGPSSIGRRSART